MFSVTDDTRYLMYIKATGYDKQFPNLTSQMNSIQYSKKLINFKFIQMDISQIFTISNS